MRISDWTDVCSSDLWFAYFAPYPVERHNQLIADYAARPGFAHRELGTSLDGRSIDYLTRTDEHTSELQALMRISYAVFCLNKKKENKWYAQEQISTPMLLKTIRLRH